MNETTNYNLNLPESSDYYDVDDYNSNFSTIDTQLKNQDNHTTSSIDSIVGVHGLRVNNSVLEAFVNGSWVPLSVNNARNNYVVASNSSSGKTNVNNISNNSVRLNLHDGTNVLSSKLIKGTGSTTVTTDSSSNIVINTSVPTYSMSTGSVGGNNGIKLTRSDGTSTGVSIRAFDSKISITRADGSNTIYIKQNTTDPDTMIACCQIRYVGIAANGSVDVTVTIDEFPDTAELMPIVSLGSLRDTSVFSCCAYGVNGNTFKVRLRSRSSNNINDTIIVNCIVCNLDNINTSYYETEMGS